MRFFVPVGIKRYRNNISVIFAIFIYRFGNTDIDRTGKTNEPAAVADDPAITGYTEDKLYGLDLAAGRFAAADSEREYYEANGYCRTIL